MSFPIVFYNNQSAANVVNKEIAQVVSVNGTLRDGSSIYDPTILFELSDDTFIADGVNYFYVASFGRYYHITNIISKNYGLWEVHGHVDVLMSFSEQIKEQVAVVARQEATYNLMLDDGFFMTYQNPKFQTKRFSVEGPFETQEFVLIVAGS